MKYFLLSLLSGLGFLQANTYSGEAMRPLLTTNFTFALENHNSVLWLGFQDKPGYGRMPAVEFKSQRYCRAALPADFEFEASFSVVSATVYFTGANFKTVEKGFISSSSLKPLSNLMERSIPGSIIVFDEVKVKGPDNEVRTIPGITLQLY